MSDFKLVKLIDPINNTIITGGLVPRGEYSATTDYAVGDSVEYNGTSYVMFVDAPTGTLPTDDTYWQILAEKGATGNIWDWKGVWITSTSYVIDDGVENNGSTYICISDHTSASITEPGAGANWETCWDLVAEKGNTGAQGPAGESSSYLIKTSNYTLTDNDDIIYLDTDSSTLIATLPETPTDSKVFTIKNIGSSSNNATVNRNGETIDGLTSDLTLRDGEAVKLQYTSQGWLII